MNPSIETSIENLENIIKNPSTFDMYFARSIIDEIEPHLSEITSLVSEIAKLPKPITIAFKDSVAVLTAIPSAITIEFTLNSGIIETLQFECSGHKDDDHHLTLYIPEGNDEPVFTISESTGNSTLHSKHYPVTINFLVAILSAKEYINTPSITVGA